MVRQGCVLSPLPFNIYFREFGMKVAPVTRFQVFMVNKDGIIEENRQAGFLYADDVCLMVSNEQHLQFHFFLPDARIKEYMA